MEKHQCRICSKCFPTGRSLGGHMRSHIFSYTAEAGKKKLAGQVGGCSAGYGIRENPKKLWRVSDLADYDPASSSSSLKWKQCRECSKVFPSSKALFGHMRCHSSKICRRGSQTEHRQEQDQEEEEEGSWSGHKFSQESTSDNNAPPAESGWNHRSNLASAVIQAVAAATSSSITAYEQEQEEVAVSLMMLSRDFSGCWAPGSESSDKHSVVFEEEDLRSELGYFDCEYLEEADNSGDEPMRKRTPNLAEFGNKTATIDEKRHCFNAYESKLGEIKSKLESAYQCTSCSRSFHSYQALGGHRASHKRIRTCCLQKPSSSFDGTHEPNGVDQLPLEIEISPSRQSNKSRIHRCSICEKTFSSGQALGGHKRSHIAPTADAGIQSDNNTTVVAVAVAVAVKVPELLDLNFPAPVDEESSNVKPWRTCDSISHEQQHLVDFISN